MKYVLFFPILIFLQPAFGESGSLEEAAKNLIQGNIEGAQSHLEDQKTANSVDCLKEALGQMARDEWETAPCLTAEQKGLLFILALQNGEMSVVDSLLEEDFDMDSRDTDNLTPLHLASFGGHTDTALALIERGADVNSRNTDNFTPLHLASREGHIGVVLELIKRGADVNRGNDNNVTPLHEASAEGHTDTVCALIKHGADVNKQNNFGSTALDYASRNGHIETARVLRGKRDACEKESS